MSLLRVPADLLARRRGEPSWSSWLERLPALTAEVVSEWALEVDGAPVPGSASVVLPVRTGAGRPAALKVGWPHPEAEHEHLALQHWHGQGAAQLLRADPRRSALLLERLHAGEDLGGLRDVEACEVVAGLYRRLHRPAVPRLRRLSAYVAARTDELARLPRGAPLPRRLVEQAVSLGRSLADDPATDGTLVHTDLHYGNVLAADREPWLAIDPKPLSGDPHYEPAPLLWNRWADVAGAPGSSRVREGLRQRFFAVVDAAGLDEDRARAWVVVRTVHNVAAGLLRAEPGEATDVTRCVTIAKAVQD